MNCNYRHCGAELPLDINGNRRYCDDDCSNAERLERERDKYNTKKSVLLEIKRIETLLRVCYNSYGEAPFEVNILREMKMNWSLMSCITPVNEMDYRVVGSFGYVVFKNDTIKIIKI